MALIFFMRRMLSVVYLIAHPAVPLYLKMLPVLALAYLIWPRDLWFDYRPFGFVDDIIIGFILLSIFTARAWPLAAKADNRKEELRKDSIKVDFKVVEEEKTQEAEKQTSESKRG